jgi:hypothetical protein
MKRGAHWAPLFFKPFFQGFNKGGVKTSFDAFNARSNKVIRKRSESYELLKYHVDMSTAMVPFNAGSCPDGCAMGTR